MKFTYSFYLIILLVSCTGKHYKAVDDASNDTIRHPATLDKFYSEECLNHCSGYYNKYGLAISNFYKNADAIEFDFNKDGEADSLVILKPFYYGNPVFNNKCRYSDEDGNSLINDKIFLICQVEKGTIVKVYIYKDLLNNSDWTLGGESIELHKNSFSINGQWGHSNQFSSNIYISHEKPDFYVDSVYIESNGSTQYHKCYQIKKKLNGFNYSVVDSLKSLNEK